ncbi:hypothetical protein LTR22_027146, partial [Elasticomyces elasticus]
DFHTPTGLLQGAQRSALPTTRRIVEQQSRCQHAITLLKQDVYVVHTAHCRLNAEHAHLPLENQVSGFAELPLLQKLDILRQVQQAGKRSSSALSDANNDI